MFVQLSGSGSKMPLTGFGTWRLRQPELEPAIREAMRAGYRHFDGAAIYENEAELGSVFNSIISKEKLISRSEVITRYVIIYLYFRSVLVIYYIKVMGH